MRQIRLNFSDLKTKEVLDEALAAIRALVEENEGTVYLEATIVKESDNG